MKQKKLRLQSFEQFGMRQHRRNFTGMDGDADPRKGAVRFAISNSIGASGFALTAFGAPALLSVIRSSTACWLRTPRAMTYGHGRASGRT